MYSRFLFNHVSFITLVVTSGFSQFADLYGTKECGIVDIITCTALNRKLQNVFNIIKTRFNLRLVLQYPNGLLLAFGPFGKDLN